MAIKTLTTDLIDRKTASRLLKTSIRTIDRYRHSGRLSTTIVDNRIYIKKEEISDFIERQSRQRQKTYVSTEDRVDSGSATHDKGHDNGQDDRLDKEAEPIRSHHEHDVRMDEYYKKMVEELMRDIREKQEKLEAANYQVGKLETQLRMSVPLVEFQKEKKQLLLESSQYQKIAQQKDEIARQKDGALKRLQKDFFLERLNKRVYLLITLGLILLQPLILLLIK